MAAAVDIAAYKDVLIILASTAVTDRVDTLGTLLVRTEPFANSAQNLYGALSVADAASRTW